MVKVFKWAWVNPGLVYKMIEKLEEITMQLNKIVHWDIAKLLELGVSEEWLKITNPTPQQIKDLLKGLLYLRERAKDTRSKDV